MLLKAITCLLPWSLKRRVLQRRFGFEIHPTARIGLSWIFPVQLKMAAHSRIGHLNVAIHAEKIELGEFATIGRRNWITGFPLHSASGHFAHQQDRMPALIVGRHSAITKNHHIDCTHQVTFGAFCTMAGYYSQILTHSVDIYENRQDSQPVSIGDYCFIGTNVVILGGAILPDKSVLGAKSLLAKALDQPCWLYGGVPARALKQLPPSAKYFARTQGRVL